MMRSWFGTFIKDFSVKLGAGAQSWAQRWAQRLSTQNRTWRARKKSRPAKSPRDEMRWGRSLVGALLVVILVGIASVVMTNHIAAVERERCFDRLYEEGSDVATYIEHVVAHDREELKLLAALVAQSEEVTDPKLWQLLSSFKAVGFMSKIGLLLPDDTLVYGTGQKLNVKGKLSFDSEAALGAHISARSTSLFDPNKYVLRHFVPVERAGQVVGMLYGLVVLDQLPISMSSLPYTGKGAIFLIESDTGNYLIDTWHQGPLGNIWQKGERELASGYNFADFKRGLIEGQLGVMSYFSRTIGDFVYYHYRPLGINNWRVAVSVPEVVVMANAKHIETSLHTFLGVEFVCFALYLLWVLNDARLVTALKQRRLDNVQHLHEIEQFLFNAHEKKENLYAAIEKMGQVMGCERLNFWFLDRGINHHYCWEQGKPTEEGTDASLLPVKLLKNFAAGAELFVADTPAEIAAILPDGAKAGNDNGANAATKLKNVMAVPVRDVVAGQLCGVLALSNIKKGARNVPLLRALSFSFGMYCNNVKNRADLQEQGDRDTLTGMFNRNRYERDLPELFNQYQAALTCIYIDVNGLREMNNTKGHDLGDVMLRTVAQAITTYFPGPYQYRVGGDEFVLFVPAGDEAELTKCSVDLAANIAQYDYHISVGIESQHQVATIAQLIKAAEQKMYDQKRAFYATRDRRQMHVA